MLTPQASNSTGLNWTGGGVTVYCAAGAWPPVAKVPSLNDPVAWPTIPELGEKIVLTSKTTGLANNKTTRVPILNLQLSSKSVAKTGKAEKDELAAHYVGLIGENKGKISYITLRDPDIQVNVKTETVAAGALPEANQLRLTATKFITTLEDTDDENWRDVRAVGALCGVNTGTLENCALTRGTNSSTSALVAAALAFGDSTTATAAHTADDWTRRQQKLYLLYRRAARHWRSRRRCHTQSRFRHAESDRCVGRGGSGSACGQGHAIRCRDHSGRPAGREGPLRRRGSRAE